eukprot:CAMPEP_0201725288 /NCGR_PEP_ID=MMETSP0593-20130828/8729_1 /ASSEMBLY_ACC=CAM_ASM_000672 /TAXON_ID=267983 /ORGANISM="Skeletonema japonicum, Strain CCMP2506" /LENGTH=513 /DNA_ID=CAMNT_0048216641 /DNA_START=31 /DNA_END=1572 /DNA_ORIENTATION=-
MASLAFTARVNSLRKCSSSLRGAVGGRQFSTRASVNTDDSERAIKKHPQSFVTDEVPLEDGELSDLPPFFHQNLRRGPSPPSHSKHSRHENDGRDSYWRPPWKSRADIISAEDFANRPRVTFSEHFASLHDAMATLTWMTQNEKDGIYQMYCDLMTVMAEKGEDPKKDSWGVLTTNTSHEYIVRVIAQHYNITTSRAAGVIQLQHNEEQLKKDPNFKIRHDLQAFVDGRVRDSHREVYQSYGEKDPMAFAEDPVASAGFLAREDVGSAAVVGASDLVDIDALVKKVKRMERDEASMRIKNHIYVEDVDDRTRKVKVDKEAKRLEKSKKALAGLYDLTKASGDGGEEKDTATIKTKVPPIPEGALPYPDNNVGYQETPKTRRPRWKFAAQIINTHTLENPPGSSQHGKRVAKRTKARRHGRIVDGNTLIEKDGEVRVATVAELEQTSWKHVRNESEFMFKGVKAAWMRRQLEQEVGGWGRQEEIYNEPEVEDESEGEETAENEGEAEGSDDNEK